MAPPQPIETERLLLRQFVADDAEEFLPLGSHPDVIRFTGERPLQSAKASRELLVANQLRDYSVHGYGRMACIEKSSGRMIGFSGLKFLEDMQETDIGYRFLPDCWGKGFATESSLAVIRAQCVPLGLTRLIGLVLPDNTASANVLRKLGLRFERLIDDPICGEAQLYANSVPEVLRLAELNFPSG